MGPSASEAASESAKQRLPPLRRQALSSEQAAPRNQIETTFLAQHVLRLLFLVFDLCGVQIAFKLSLMLQQ